jgi:hypothetical protein
VIGPLSDLAEDLSDVFEVALGVDPAWDGQTDKLEWGSRQWAAFGVLCAEVERAAFHRADAAF